jgi:hypothetical protein
MEMRQKGLLFSLDGILSLVLVIILAGAIVQQISFEEKGNAFEGLHDRAFDRAIVDNYRGVASAETIGAAAEFGECAVVYYLDPDNAVDTRAQALAQSFCEET